MQKTIFITGASSGIGQACAKRFAQEGARIIITARRLDRLLSLAQLCQDQYGAEVLPLALDVQDQGQVEAVVSELPKEWRSIDILLNNAGLALSSDAFQDADMMNWDRMIDTNVKGLLYVTKRILPTMLNAGSGHIINIGSVSGHDVYPGGNVYCATKYMVKAITRSLRMDLLGTGVRVSTVDPGAVETEFSLVRWKDAERAKEYYKGFSPLTAEDVAEAVLFCASAPAHVNVAEMLVLPTDQASVHHVHQQSDVVESE